MKMLQTLLCAIFLDKPTRIANHSVTLKDHSYANDHMLSGIAVYGISNLPPIFMILKKRNKNKLLNVAK